MKLNERALAAKLLATVLPYNNPESSADNSARQSLSQALKEHDGVTPLVQDICYGACRWLLDLQALIDPLLRKPLKRKDQDIYCLLLAGAYQLQATQQAPHAVLSESVNASKQLGKQWAGGLINGVLRQLQRQKPQWVPGDNHPQWLAKQLKQDWPEHWQQIINANNQRSPMTLRCPPNQQQAYLEALHNLNIKARPCIWADSGITLERPCNVDQLPGFAQGDCSVQDEAAQLACHTLLQITQDTARTLDACAAPGGKTGYLLERLKPTDQLTAVELDANRCLRIEQNLARLNLQCNLQCADLMKVSDWWDGKPFDAILLDAPCSATGVIRRHPDIKWLRRADDIEQLAEIQQQLLTALWPTLAQSGVLLYATCSTLKTENERVVKAFLEAHNDAKHMPIKAEWGVATEVGRQLFPQTNGHDGFYMAGLQKNGF